MKDDLLSTDWPDGGISALSIVVVGNMNPSIHHPAWYHAVGLLSDEEAQEAYKRDIVCMPVVAKFSTASMDVACQLDRWDVSTSTPGSAGRARKLAGRVFDELRHTPLTAMGFNFMTHRAVSRDDVPSHLASCMQRAGVGLPPDGVSGTLTYKLLDAAAQVTIAVEPSTHGPDHAFVSVNYHFDVGDIIPKGTKMFDFAPVLEKHLDAATPRAVRYIRQVIDALET